MSLGYYTAHAACGVHADFATQDRTGIQYAVTTDFNIVAEHGADFLSAGLNVIALVVDNDELLITLYVAGNGARSHMALVAED